MNGQDFLTFIGKDFPLSQLQKERFLALDALYREWNAQINVISRKDIDSVYSHHVLHSLAIGRYIYNVPGLLEKFSKGTVLDLGTGGGFPGIPLAILFPEAGFTLCDSVGKKTIVADAVVKALELENTHVVNARAESLPVQFDFVVSRAVASLQDFYPWVRGKFREGILYLKGGDVNPEISAIMEKYRLAKGSVTIWPVSSWLPDPYYDGKLLLHIRP